MSFIVIRCGSAARGDTNKNSDTDTICIWDKAKPDFKYLKKKYTDIIFHSTESIINMRRSGSLFLTHLDIDGIYLEGDKSLTKIYKNFRPNKDSLTQNISTTTQFIKSIEWYPDSAIGTLWLMDVIYVATRNIVFCQNAIESKFIFSYEPALLAFGLAGTDLYTMLKIREGKYEYRKGTNTHISPTEISFLSETISKITNINIKFKAGGTSFFDPRTKHSYWIERLIERAIINNEIHAPDFLFEIKNHNYNKSKLRTAAKKLLEHLSSQN